MTKREKYIKELTELNDKYFHATDLRDRYWLKKKMNEVESLLKDCETYKVIRFYRDERQKEVIATGLSLFEARLHCKDPKTNTDTSFDGYDAE